MRQKLETAANVAVILLALLVAYVLVRNYVLPGRSEGISGPRPGEHLTQFGTAQWPKHRRTLVLAMRTGCHYCEQSTPFYKHLVEMQASGGADFGLLAVLPDDREAARTYLGSEGLALTFEPNIALNKAGILATPTLVVVDGEGYVIRSWVGVLSAEQEAEVQKELQGG